MKPLSAFQIEALRFFPGVLYYSGGTPGLQTVLRADGFIRWRINERWPMAVRKLLRRGLIRRRRLPEYPDGDCYDLTDTGRAALAANPS